MLSDLASLFLAFSFAFFLRSQVLIHFQPFRRGLLSFWTQLSSGLVFASFVILLVFTLERLYTRRLFFWEEARLLVRGISLSFILIMTTVFVSRSSPQFSRMVIFLTWFLSLFIFPLLRRTVKMGLSRAGYWTKNVLILGTGRAAQRVVQEIMKDDALGYHIVGYLSEEGGNLGARLSGDIPVIGVISEIDILAPKTGAKDLIIALSDHLQHKLVSIAKQCEPFAETIKIVPSAGNLYTIGVNLENLGDVNVLSVPRNLAKPWNIFMKRGFELVLGLVLFLLLFPLFLIISLALVIDSRGPVIFAQWRLGSQDRKFRILKFRSMHVDGDVRLERHLKQNPELREEWQKYQKIKGYDPRVTGVGRFLRKWSLDELPQLLNVLRGDMSLVGPRPYLPRERDLIGPVHAFISRVKPGMTGLWQVRGRNILTFEDRLLLDEYYIRNWSLWLDIVILFKTVTALAKREGAF